MASFKADSKNSLVLADSVDCAGFTAIFCPDPNGDGGAIVLPDPNNNCQTVCDFSPNPLRFGSPYCTIDPQFTPLSSAGSVVFTGFYNQNGSSRFAQNYFWDFGDGTAFSTGSNSQASHFFTNSAIVSLTITDNVGQVQCSGSVNVSQSQVCPTDTMQCPDGSFVGRDPNNSCLFFPCPPQNNCQTLTCPAAPLGCFYSGQLTFSCDPNVVLTCGILNCQNMPGTITLPNLSSAITITNNNTNSNTNSNSNNIRIN